MNHSNVCTLSFETVLLAQLYPLTPLCFSESRKYSVFPCVRPATMDLVWSFLVCRDCRCLKPIVHSQWSKRKLFRALSHLSVGWQNAVKNLFRVLFIWSYRSATANRPKLLFLFSWTFCIHYLAFKRRTDWPKIELPIPTSKFFIVD